MFFYKTIYYELECNIKAQEMLWIWYDYNISSKYSPIWTPVGLCSNLHELLQLTQLLIYQAYKIFTQIRQTRSSHIQAQFNHSYTSPVQYHRRSNLPNTNRLNKGFAYTCRITWLIVSCSCPAHICVIQWVLTGLLSSYLRPS